MKMTEKQEQAVNTCGQNIIVSAGAGSGKTKVLSERVFDRISNPKFKWNIDEMLVLTFTNAAANNMKNRIRGRVALNEGNKLTKEEQKKQLNKIDSSYIMTFDAYAQSLVKKYHHVLNIDNNFIIADNNIINNRLNEYLDDIFEEEYQKQNPRFIKLINDYCIKNDDSLKEEVKTLNHKLNQLIDRNYYVSNYEDRFFDDDVLEEYLNKYVVILKANIKKINGLLDELSEHVESPKSLFIGIDLLLNANTYKEIKESCQIEIMNVPKGSGKQASEIKSKIKRLLDKLVTLTENDENDLKNEVLMTKDNVLYFIDLAQRLNNRLLEYKYLNNLFEFSDIFKMAIDLVKNHEDIRNEIKNYFKEILIDEYQDTNDIQDTFISYISNNNVYMVGDIKQSIYRFRYANPDIFKDKYDKYKSGNGGTSIDLTSNFRSRKEVLDGVNVIFNRLMDSALGGADYTNGHQMEAGNTAYEIKGEGLIESQDHNLEVLNYVYDKDNYPYTVLKKEPVEAFIIAKDIKDKIDSKYQVTYMNKEIDENGNEVEVLRTRDVEYSDFAIIAPKGTSFDVFKQVFTSVGIPLEINDTEKMDESDLMSVTRSIFKLIKCIVSNDYDYDYKMAYMSIARSFLVEMNDTDLYDVVTNSKYKDTDIHKKAEEITNNIVSKTISNILDEFIKSFDVYSKINKIGEVHENLVKIDYLYQLADSLSSSGFDYRSFNEYLDHIFEENDNKKAIEIKIKKGDKNAVIATNIHKSKGLQYTICYYPLLFGKFNRNDKNSAYNFTEELGLVLKAMIPGRGLKDTILKEIFKYDYDIKDIGEKIRLFYVALTRAREKMIIVAPLENKSIKGEKVIDFNTRLSVMSIKDMLDLIYGDLTKYIREINFDDYTNFINPRYDSTYKNVFIGLSKVGDDIQIMQSKEIKPIEITSSSFSKKAGLIKPEQLVNMETGTKVHYYLETLDFNNPDYSNVEKYYVELIKNFLNSDIMKDFKNAQIYKEYEFIYDDNGERKHGIIDLLLEYDDHFDIVDYKTKNIDDEHYDEQLNGYCKYINTISDKKVNCYLYSIIDSKYRTVE